MDKNTKVGVLVIAIIVIVLGINYISIEGKIKQANINGYAFLKEISKCDVTYAIDGSTGGFTTEFEKDCLEDAAKNLRNIPLKPGETGEKFLLESEEYLGCVEINNLRGVEFYRNCIKKILPIMEEKYPEVVMD
jgi:hypothetical protein